VLRFGLPDLEHRALDDLLEAAERGTLPFVGAFEATHGEAVIARLRHAQLARTSGLTLIPTAAAWEVGRPERLTALLDLLDDLRARLRAGSIRVGAPLADAGAARLVRTIGASGLVDVTLDDTGAPAAIVPRAALLDFRRDGFVALVPFSVSALPTLYAFGCRHFGGLTRATHADALRGATLRDCSFTACDFSGLDLHGATFEACSFERCSFAGSALHELRFAACEFHGGSFESAHFAAVDADECRFSPDLEPVVRAVLPQLRHRRLWIGSSELVARRLVVQTDTDVLKWWFDGAPVDLTPSEPAWVLAYLAAHPARDIHPLEVVAGAKLLRHPALHAELVARGAAGGWPANQPPSPAAIHAQLAEAGLAADLAAVERLCSTPSGTERLAGAARYLAMTRAVSDHCGVFEPHDLSKSLRSELQESLNAPKVTALPMPKSGAIDKLRRRAIEPLRRLCAELPAPLKEHVAGIFARLSLLRFEPDDAR
jgi:hypothetical protein